VVLATHIGGPNLSAVFTLSAAESLVQKDRPAAGPFQALLQFYVAVTER
jgi:hypothetical protein